VGYVHSVMEATFWMDKWDEYNDEDHFVAYISLGNNFAMNAKEW
jgi:hypothetical protein